MATLLSALQSRRSIYHLAAESPIPDARIEEIVRHVVLHTPSPFNTQSARLVVLLRDDHRQLWDMAYEAAKASAPADVFEARYAPRLALYKAGYGTVLFYEDPVPLKEQETKWPMLKEKFPQWSDHSSGMHQFAVWTAFAAEGLGCNLQHYNPMLNAPIAAHWNVPADWDLKAQLVFGTPTGAPREKSFEPLEKRVFVYGSEVTK